MELGFVGLGNMGGPISINLLKAGHRVAVFDVSAEAVQRVVEAGGIAADNPADVTRSAQMVLTSLSVPAIVEEVYLGPGGLLASARPGQLFVDLSSISPSLAKKIAAAFAARGAAFLEAPVSGGVRGAREATLAIMVGGDADAFQQAEPVLKNIGAKVFHVGPTGTSSTIKILNQLLVGINNTAVTEMLLLAKRTGMDLALVKEIISASSGWSRIFDIEYSKAVDGDFAAGFAVELMAKDLRLARDLAAECGSDLPVAMTALSVFEQTIGAGFGKDDVSAALKVYEAR
jgi:3-hydroxyisobutyrate dehydrogenase